jgi:hypothetical protein
MRAGSLRFGIVAVPMLAMAIGLQAHSTTEIIPPHQSLSSLPSQINGWTGTDDTLSQEDLEILGHPEYLLRDYETADPSQNWINFYVFSFAKGRRYDPFARTLPAGSGMDSDTAAGDSASPPGRIFHPRQSLRGFKVGRAATGVVLVSGAWPRGGERVVV